MRESLALGGEEFTQKQPGGRGGAGGRVFTPRPPPAGGQGEVSEIRPTAFEGDLLGTLGRLVGAPSRAGGSVRQGGEFLVAAPLAG